MIGYRLSIQFNDSYAFRDRPTIGEGNPSYELHQAIVPDMSGTPHSGVRRCGTCGALLEKWDDSLPGLVIKKRCFDIAITYDGVLVVSKAFKTVYESNGLSGLRFVPLPDDPTFCSINAAGVVEFDAVRRGTRFVRQCATCEQFESIVGATPIYLKEGSMIPDVGFVRTDLEFGSEDERHPLLLCGASAGKALDNAALNGLDLVEF
jgi:hypothetical protein